MGCLQIWSSRGRGSRRESKRENSRLFPLAISLPGKGNSSPIPSEPPGKRRGNPQGIPSCQFPLLLDYLVQGVLLDGGGVQPLPTHTRRTPWLVGWLGRFLSPPWGSHVTTKQLSAPVTLPPLLMPERGIRRGHVISGFRDPGGGSPSGTSPRCPRSMEGRGNQTPGGQEFGRTFLFLTKGTSHTGNFSPWQPGALKTFSLEET